MFRYRRAFRETPAGARKYFSGSTSSNFANFRQWREHQQIAERRRGDALRYRESGDQGAAEAAAIVLCGLGYAEGAKLSRKLGGWQVICWALTLSLPVTVGLALYTLPPSFAEVGKAAWIGLAYVSLFSMLIGFVFWYRGLAHGGIAAVGQLQLLQPFFGLALAATLLHEPVSPIMLIVTVAVVGCVAGAKRFAR